MRLIIRELWGLAFGLLLAGLSGCLFPTTKPQDLAATWTAQPFVESSPTQAPTWTPLPVFTGTPLPVLTETPAPTASEMPAPSQTPTATLSQGPVLFKDNFSQENHTAWADCAACQWQDGALVVGPYPPGGDSNLPRIVTCAACGEHTYYRVAVNAALASDDADKSFGLLIASNPNELVMLGIDASQSCVVARYDPGSKRWQLLNADPLQVWNGSLKKGSRTNQLEVVVQPSETKTGAVDYTVNLNGSTSFVLKGQPAYPSKVGLLVDDPSLVVRFSNFEYEELTP